VKQEPDGLGAKERVARTVRKPSLATVTQPLYTGLMQSQATTLDQPADLKRHILSMKIRGRNHVAFEQALAEAQGWTVAYAAKVAREYRRFLYLAATAGREVTPSRDVDEAWHLHLSWPHYEDIFCREILRRPLDHRPGTGDPADEARFREQYQDTLDLYADTFGTPPKAVWPRPEAPDERDESLGRTFWTLLAIAMLAIILTGALYDGVAAFLLGLLAATIFGIYAVSRAVAHGPGKRAHGGSDCGGSCSTSSSDDCGSDGGSDCGDGGGSSCGGGCGGGD